jgi:hypothetical protein
MKTNAEETGHVEAIEIRIRGQIDKHWSDWLGGLTIAHNAAGDTVLTGTARDQSALVGLLTRLSGLGLQVISLASTGSAPEGDKEVGKM